MITVATVNGTTSQQGWNRLYKRLKGGFFQILLEGNRPEDKRDSGVAIDDIFIVSCSTFRE